MSIKAFSETYSIKIWGAREDKKKGVGFPTWAEVYRASIIGWDSYLEACTIMTVKTSNSMREIEEMEFYKFNLLMKYLDKYIDKENKAQSGDQNGSTEQDAEDMKNKTARELARTKRHGQYANKMPSFKMPKMTMPKYK